MDTNRKNNQPHQEERKSLGNKLESRSTIPGDLPDSKKDMDELKTEETFIDLPDVKDIPGQEFVNVPPLGALGDTTIASDDEEGIGIFDLDESEDFTPGTEAAVSNSEREALEQTDYLPTQDEDNLLKARMDNVDFENTPLNERSFGEVRTASDMDISRTGFDGTIEQVIEEDEENNDDSDEVTITERKP